MRHGRFTNERGSALLFSIAVLVFLLVMGGIAIDLTYFSAARGEIQRSMDAAALAGAGKLWFDDSVFPAVRDWAARYAQKNGLRNPMGGIINLDPNWSNDPGGNIVLGIWNGSSFNPDLDGTQVNAVRCQYTTQIPTSFLRLLGFSTLPVSAQAIAISNPPANPPPDACLFPIGLSQCAFQNAGAFNSQGCGAAVTLISSSGAAPGSTGGTNTAAWVNLNGSGTPSAPTTNTAINGAANGGTCTSSLATGDPIGTSNGMQQSVFNNLEDQFKSKFASSPWIEVKNSSTPDPDDYSYQGYGWEVYVPVIQTACPPQGITGNLVIAGWTRMVITQVINLGDCAVNNPQDANSYPLCPPPYGTAAKNPDLRAVFGYYECSVWESNPVPLPAPRTALAERMRLVR